MRERVRSWNTQLTVTPILFVQFVFAQNRQNETKPTGDEWTYGYNNADQLISAIETSAGGTVETQVVIQYDVFGNRLQEQVWTQSAGWTTTRYAYDAWDPATPSGVGNENWKVWATLDGSNNLVTRYINGDALDQVFAQISAGSGVAWYLTDRLGSTRALIDSNGNVLDAITYDAWGNITSQTNPSLQPIVMFAGMAYDAVLVLYVGGNGIRYYDPATGRFLEQDPMQFRAGSSNLYCYVENDPTNYTDPSGEYVPRSPKGWAQWIDNAFLGLSVNDLKQRMMFGTGKWEIENAISLGKWSLGNFENQVNGEIRTLETIIPYVERIIGANSRLLARPNLTKEQREAAKNDEVKYKAELEDLKADLKSLKEWQEKIKAMKAKYAALESGATESSINKATVTLPQEYQPPR